MHPLTLRLFGGPILHNGDASIPLTPAQAVFISVLAVEEQAGVPRNRLATLLWPAAPWDASTRHRLSQLQYSLHTRTGHVLSVRIGERLALKHDTITTDYLTIACNSEHRAKPDEMSRLLASGLLPYLDDVDNEQLVDWLTDRRLRFRDSLRRQATAAWSQLSKSANWSEAIGFAELLFRLDPTEEVGLQRLLRTRAMCGSVHEAEATYHSFRDRMESGGTHWSPSEATRQILSRLSTLEHVLRPPSARLCGTPDPPLIGREEVLDQLLAAVRAPSSSEVDVVLVTGEAGMGKTRLLREIVTPSHLSGHLVLWGASSELERDIPLNPLIDAFGVESVGRAVTSLEEPWKSVLIAFLPHLHEGPGPLPAPPDIRQGATPRRLFEAVTVLLQTLCLTEKVLLVLDDFHWTDDTTVAVLAYLHRRWRNGGLRIVLAFRPEALDGRRMPRQLLNDIRASPRFSEMLLDELTPKAADALAAMVASRPLTPEEVRRLGHLAARNPFFVIELTSELTSGTLRAPDSPLDQGVPLPFSIRQVFDRRLSSLTPSAERCASLLAVYDGPLGIDDLANLSRLSQVSCVDALAELDASRLITWRGAQVDILHAIVRQAIIGQLTSARRLWLHGRVARSLMATAPWDSDRLALHCHGAGMKRDAMCFATQAAERAEHSGAVAEALRFYGIAQENATSEVERAGIIGRIAHLRYLYRSFDEACPLLAQAALLFGELGMAGSQLRVSIQRLDGLLQGHSPPPADDLLLQIRAAETAAFDGGHVEEVARAMDVELRFWDQRGNEAEVIALLSRADEVLRVTRHPAARSALHRLLALHLYYGDVKRALRSARQSIAEARRANGRDDLLSSLNRLIVVLLHQGRLDAAEGVAAVGEAEELASSSGDLFLKYSVRLNSGVWALDIGELERAWVAFRRTREVLPPTPDLTHLVLACNVGEMHLAADRPQEAEVVLKEAKAIFRAGMPGYLEGVTDAGLGLCALSLGRLREAQGIEARLRVPSQRWCYDPSLIVSFRAQLLARLGRRREALDLLSAACADIAGRLVTNWVKLRLEHHRIAVRTGMLSRAEVMETLEVAEALQLATRTSQLLAISEAVR